MSPLRLHTRREALFAWVAATTATLGILGGIVLMFGAAGSTPAFEPGSMLADQAVHCREEATMPKRHQCLRKIAAAAANANKGAIELAAASREPRVR